ncbi:frataxin domain-containing protein [Candidatus Anaplasma sp. TIGMIC]|uniref:frataxin domain-containing protein n=1 Tax=Candidatus Anaplasma sp. TIGMIC TaxID=3020713 RepID=UPI00232CA88E|nr:frataxin domain-containing protein [Candidatus Anaplasma sp. TIGMIC]MDB1135138.1 frataxin domain-containing protein [Candidatus Anaplasma sp. TIGMIC]
MVSENSGSGMHAAASSMLDSILMMVEAMVDSAGAAVCCDSDGSIVEISGCGVVYLVSWHAPSAQIWVASPCSGSVRFSYDPDKDLWWDCRDKRELADFVRQEVIAIFGLAEE